MPRLVDPSIKVTVPVGVPTPGAVAETTAVKEIVGSCKAEAGGRVKVVWVLALITTSVKGLELLL